MSSTVPNGAHEALELILLSQQFLSENITDEEFKERYNEILDNADENGRLDSIIMCTTMLASQYATDIARLVEYRGGASALLETSLLENMLLE